jgi:hypothetical protein
MAGKDAVVPKKTVLDLSLEEDRVKSSPRQSPEDREYGMDKFTDS